jgi:site-specific recombinase XerD
MNLEHVSVESSQSRHQHRPPQENKSAIFPRKDIEASFQPRSTKADIDQILARLLDKGLSGKEHVKAYLHDMYRRNCRPRTIRTNSCSVILFLAFLKDLGKDQLEMITREDISAFIEAEQDRAMKPNTVNTRLRALYAFLNFLIQADVLHPDLLKRKLRIKLPDALPRAIDPEDIKQLLAVLKAPRDRALILTLLRTGMRIGELLNTKIQDLNLKAQCIEIFEAQKNRVGRVVYLSKDAQAALKKWLKRKRPQTDYLF